MCGIVGVELPARNKGMRGTLPTMWSTGATYRHGIGPGSYSLSTPASSIGPWMGKFSSSNVLKKTRLNKRSSGPIWYDGFLGSHPPVERKWWHWKKSWGRAYQQSLKGTSPISSVMLRCCKNMAGSRQWCPTHTPAPQHRNNNVNISCIYQYIPVHTSTYQYILVCTSMYWYVLVHTSTYWSVQVCTGSGMY